MTNNKSNNLDEMDKFHERHTLPKTSQYEIPTLYIPSSTKETKFTV